MKMKKVVALMLCTALMLVPTACGKKAESPNPAPAPAASTPADAPTTEVQAPVKITIVSHFTEDYLSYKAMHDACEDITEKTGGAVTFEYYPLEQMVKANEEFDAVSTGIADMAPLFPGNASGIEPMLSASDQPFEYTDFEHFLRAWNAGQKEIMEEIFANHNMKLLGVTIPYLNGTMIMTRKEVHAPSDMNGLKIRSVGVAAGEVVTGCGAAPVSMSSSEYYLALSNNTIDGVTTSLLPGLERSVQEVVTNILDYNMSIPYDYAAINLDTWNKLTAETQKLFIDHFGESYTRDVIKDAEAQDAEAREKYTSAGVSFYAPTADEAAQWNEIGASATEAFLNTAGIEELAQRYLEIANQTR